MPDLDSWYFFVRQIAGSCPILTIFRSGLMSEFLLKRSTSFNENIMIINYKYYLMRYNMSIIHTNIRFTDVKVKIFNNFLYWGLASTVD